MVCRLPDGRLKFSNPDCGGAHDERACENTTGGFGGKDELCVGFGRGLVVVIGGDDGAAGILPLELRLSAAWSVWLRAPTGGRCEGADSPLPARWCVGRCV